MIEFNSDVIDHIVSVSEEEVCEVRELSVLGREFQKPLAKILVVESRLGLISSLLVFEDNPTLAIRSVSVVRTVDTKLKKLEAFEESLDVLKS